MLMSYLGALTILHGLRHDIISGAVTEDYVWILKASESIAQDELKSDDIGT